jgi:hypothetical protein
MEAPGDQSPGVKISTAKEGMPHQLPTEQSKDLVPIGSSGRTMIQVGNGINNDSIDSLNSKEAERKKQGIF